MLQIPPQKVPLTENEHGVLRVAGTRVSLDSVVRAFQNGETAEEIAQNFPTLDLKDIYAVIAYYLDNKDAVAQYLSDQEKEAEALKQQIEAQFPTNHLRERIIKRRDSQQG